MIVADTNILSTFARIHLFDGLASGAGFYSVELTADEKSVVDRLPGSLNAGEKESIAICSIRAGGKLLTNDKRAHNYCR